MYKIVTFQDVVRIPPALFGQDIQKVAEKELKEKYENTYDDEMGYIFLIRDVKVDPLGKILPSDGASYHRARFKVYSFKPLINEIVEGEVVEVTDFGVFVRIGPLDALLHISQIMNDYIVVDTAQGTVRGKETNRILRIGDIVRARIIAVSPPRGLSIGKIGLTARQPYLGKLEWIEEDIFGKKEKEVAKSEKSKA